ncbi:hypothetical protein CC78DRAFT_378828 [Lojkania enalia]|uniref:SET domain-containing protein n=1 Tax=Lojkania enalia TaxID=147567 RepID=A0A9P4N977_9PLEO|nr:hypothetical protein CC78DRAFT_378828 [Didymosphaeria enalia]
MPVSQSVSPKTPKNWPKTIEYLHAPSYSKKIQDEALNAIVFPKSNLSAHETLQHAAGPFAIIKIVRITDSSHPAYGQHGLFASKHLAPDSFVLPYLGYVHDKTDTDDESDYDLSLDRHYGIGVDASRMGNEARFINDYRGVSTKGPNAEFRDLFVDIGNGKVEKTMGVFVLRAGKSGKRAKGIAKGEEILVSYGKGFWTERQTI